MTQVLASSIQANFPEAVSVTAWNWAMNFCQSLQSFSWTSSPFEGSPAFLKEMLVRNIRLFRLHDRTLFRLPWWDRTVCSRLTCFHSKTGDKTLITITFAWLWSGSSWTACYCCGDDARKTLEWCLRQGVTASLTACIWHFISAASLPSTLHMLKENINDRLRRAKQLWFCTKVLSHIVWLSPQPFPSILSRTSTPLLLLLWHTVYHIYFTAL